MRHIQWRVVFRSLLASALLGGASLPAAWGGAKDLVDTASAAGNFRTLVTAVKTAGLVDTLRGEGPFTVFAPTDEAFAKLPKGALDKLLANPDALKAVLLQHVVAGKVTAADVVKLTSAKTVLGQTVAIDATNGVTVSGAKVTATDVMASNGVIHVIDTVILPANDIIESARSAGNFKTLLKALDAAGLTDVLRTEGPFTVFAPTDEAFAKLPPAALDALLADKGRLAEVLKYHVVAGKVTAADAARLSSAKTLQGGELTIAAHKGVMIDNARVTAADVAATNGVIHVIDTVLLPK